MLEETTLGLRIVYHRIMPLSATPEQEFIPEPLTPVAERITALKRLNCLAGMSEQEYQWMAEHGQERRIPTGAVLFREGEEAHAMTILLEGEIQVYRERSGPMAVFTGRAGQITGLLPFSRMKSFGARGQVSADLWSLQYPKTIFDEMLRAVPSMAQRSVSVLLDRTREITRLEQQNEKLTALGKLAANLAHELNNPASAAQRSAAGLLKELKLFGQHKFDLGSLCLGLEAIEALRQWQLSIMERSAERSSAKAQSAAGSSAASTSAHDDEALLAWLKAHHVDHAWKICPDLCEAHVGPADLEQLNSLVGTDSLSVVLGQFASSLRTERMAQAMLDSTARIFDLITAIKDYSYLDQAPIQDVDVPQSLDTTLAMFQSRVGETEIERRYQPNLPRIPAYGSELNQVWTAIVENALDATEGKGKIVLGAKQEGDSMIVEVWDSGAGIAPEIADRIFEPFFSTKHPGDGLGLGLDTVQRIVRRHSGSVNVTSNPGATCFQVRLPIEPLQAY